MNDDRNELLVVDRNDLRRCRTLSVPNSPVEEGAALLRVETFGLSSNNVTYLALGDAMPYREFFPVPEGVLEDQWCCPPVWGVASVIESAATGLEVGDSVYGFYPAARYCRLIPTEATQAGFRVERPHIPAKLAFYHQYAVEGRDPFFLSGLEAMMVVMRPLFLTGLLLDDYLRSIDFAGAGRVIVSSSASKTAYGFATALTTSAGVEVIGLASGRSRSSAEGFGLYDRVVPYEQIENLEIDRSSVYIDISGSVAIRQRLADHLGEELKLIISVGLTHWSEGEYGGRQGSSEMRSEVFFAPGWFSNRLQAGGSAFIAGLLSGWNAQVKGAAGHFEVVTTRGARALESSYLAMVQGHIDPSRAHVHCL